MGVHGLTTYLRTNNALAQTLQFTAQQKGQSRTAFVIDGWSFIYETFASLDLPWVYGGEYYHFAANIASIVQAWLNVGLSLYFVFDGPFPELKFPTITSRMTENNIKPSLLFFRTSSVSRTKPKFLRESAMLPPRAYAACIETLRRLQTTLEHGDDLHMHFADEEGDPYAVEMAARLGGYVVGKDSDFVILNAEGYRGYIPLDEMIWSTVTDEADSVTSDGWEDDDGFQTVINSKSRKKAAAQQKFGGPSNHGIIPPEGALLDTLQLSVTIYSPIHLAAHLEIPLSLLPLLAALVGNDFTGARHDPSSATISQLTNLQWLFFERQLTLTGRILRVATTLRSILHAALTPSGKKNKSRAKVSSVMELIDRAVTALIVRNVESLASGEKERVVERVVEATLQYAIPKWEGDVGQLWSSDVCALHGPGSCPLVLLQSLPQSDHSVDVQSPHSATPSENGFEPTDTHPKSELAQLRALYVSAYRRGHIDPHTLDPLHSGTFWYRQFLENPDLESVSKTFARPIQLLTYAVLDDTFGLPQRATPSSDDAEEEEVSEDNEDELIDVTEETDTEEDDPLAPLRGALQQLNEPTTAVKPNPNGEASSFNTSAHSGIPEPLKTVKEYLRRGTRVATEDVEVPPLAELISRSSNPSRDDNLVSLPLALQPPEQRVKVLLHAVGTPGDQLPLMLQVLHELSAEQRVPLLTLRAVLSRLHTRARQSGGSKEREKEKWTKQEARAFLASFAWEPPTPSGSHKIEVEIPIMDRSVQLTAQVLATMDAIERLSQCLLLATPNSSNDELTFPTPALLFSGKTFHAYLSNTQSIPRDAVSAFLWDAMCKGMEGTFSEPHGRKRKKDKDSKTGTGQATPVAHIRGAQKSAAPVSGGKFGLLAGLSVE